MSRRLQTLKIELIPLEQIKQKIIKIERKEKGEKFSNKHHHGHLRQTYRPQSPKHHQVQREKYPARHP